MNESCFTDIFLTTNGTYDYTVLESLEPSSNICGEMNFQILGEKNAFVALFSGNDDSEPLYEIVFGIQDMYSTIRKGKGGLDITGYLSSYDVFFPSQGIAWKNFTIIWNNGSIFAKTLHFHMSWSDNLPLSVKKIAITTAGSATAEWHFNTEGINILKDPISLSFCVIA